MNINITFLCVIVLTLFLIVHGYKKGMTREISGLVALFAGLFFKDASWVGTLMYFVGKTNNILYAFLPLIVFLYLIPCFLIFNKGSKNYLSTGS